MTVTAMNVPLRVENIPAELQERSQWVVWRYVTGESKPTKLPYSINDEPAESNNPLTWTTFAQALAHYRNHASVYAGIGYVFSPDDGFFGVDLDDCLDGFGQPFPRAKRIIDGMATYCEISPSGKGVKMIGKGAKPGTRCKRVNVEWDAGATGKIEIYDQRRFWTFTGNILGELRTIEHRQDALNKLYNWTFPPKQAANQARIQQGRNSGVNEFDRCRRYLEKLDDSISGMGGHDRFFQAACVCMRFDQSDAETREHLQWWSAQKSGNEPWNDREIDHKIESARDEVASCGEIGVLLKTEPPVRTSTSRRRDQSSSDPCPLLNLDQIEEANEVIAVSDKQSAVALSQLGFVATVVGGACAKDADFSPLAGKTVYLWANCDAAAGGGRESIAAMRKAESRLNALDPAPRLLRVDQDSLGLPVGSTISDYLKRDADLDAKGKALLVRNVLLDAQPIGASAEVRSYIQDVISGRYKTIVIPQAPILSALSKALVPGGVVIQVGDPGASKTMFSLECLWRLSASGVKVAMLQLEEERRHSIMRVIAQRSEKAGMTDDKWIADNPDIAQDIERQHADFVDRFGSCITIGGNDINSLPSVAKWVERKAMGGCRVVCIDPISAATTEEARFVDDLNFMNSVKSIAAQFEMSVILTTHPRGGFNNKLSLDSIAGGRAYARFSQCILWLVHDPNPKHVTVKNNTTFGTLKESVQPDRVMHIMKARNGRGAGLKIGFTMSQDTLCFKELGVIMKDDAE